MSLLRFSFTSYGMSLFIIAMLNASCNGPTGPTHPTVALSAMSILFFDTDEQPITITNLVNEPVQWRIQSSSASWLNASPASGSVGPGGSGILTVQVDRDAVSSGTHAAALQIKAGSDVHTLNVVVEENATEAIARFEPTSLNLGPLAETGLIEVVNPSPYRMDWELASWAPWATVKPSTGSLASGGRAQVVVTVNRSGLTAGKYIGTLGLSSNAGPQSATLAIEVGGAAGIHLDPPLLEFGLTNSQLSLRIVNDGYQSLNWSAQPGGSWINVSPLAGQIPPQSSAPVVVRVSRNGLAHGPHQAGIQFLSNAGAAAATVKAMAAPLGSPSPSPPSHGPLIDIQPKSIDFGQGATELSLVIFNTGDQALDWMGSEHQTWASISPGSGRVPPHSSSTAKVKVSRVGLTAGGYQTIISFSSNGGSASTTVKMAVAPSSPPGPIPEPDPDPDPNPGSAKIELSPTVLDFGGVTTQLNLLVKNKGGSPLNWSAQESSGWLTLSGTSGTVSPGSSGQIVTVHASRSELSAAGVYEASIMFTSNGGTVIVPVVLQVPTPDTPPPTSSTPKLSDIDASGTKDVTHQLNAYLASVPDGSVIQLPAGARYRIEGIVRLIGRKNLTIEGNGALLSATTTGSSVSPPPGFARNWPRNRYHLEIRGGSGIVIRNLIVRGANPNAGVGDAAYVSALEAQHAFAILGSTDIELDHVRASDVYGDFVYIGAIDEEDGPGNVWSRNIHIHDSRFERNGRQGIAVTSGQGVLIERNYISDTRRATFDLEPHVETGGALDIVIRDNEIGQGRLKFLASSGGGPNISFTVENNTLHRAMNIVVETPPGYRRGPIRVVGNVSDQSFGSPTAAALDFLRIDGLVIRGNHQPMQEWRDQPFVWACESTGVDVRDNDVLGASSEFEVVDTCVAN